MIGIWQLILIFAIILVLFGAGRITPIMKDLGSGLRAFKKGIEGGDDEIKEIDLTVDKNKENKKIKNNFKKNKKGSKSKKNTKKIKNNKKKDQKK